MAPKLCPVTHDCGEGSSSDDLNFRKSRVSFKSEIHVQSTLNREDYTLEEAGGSWFSAAEKVKMFLYHDKTVQRMESGKRSKKNSSYRGLENFSKANASELEIVIHACVDAVMDEQEKQWKLDVCDWERFAAVSREVSEESLTLSRKMAEHDQRQARKAYKSMDKEQDQDADSACTERTNSTLTHEMKVKHRKKSTKSVPQKKKERSSRPPKSRSSGSRKSLSQKLDKLIQQAHPHTS
jgi:hypothetical protein